MRIVFEFNGSEPEVSFTGRALDSDHRKKPCWEGAFVEGIITDAPASRVNPEPDALYIEGKLSSLRSALQEALKQLDSLEQGFRDEVEARIERSRQCAACEMWFDTKHPTHADGRGMICLGDGTVLLLRRRVLYLAADGGTISIPVTDLRAGERFFIPDPMAVYEDRVFEALEDATEHDGSPAVRVLRDPPAR